MSNHAYRSVYGRKILIQEGVRIRMNGRASIITEVWPGVGFYYADETNLAEVSFCNTMFSSLNFIPVYPETEVTG